MKIVVFSDTHLNKSFNEKKFTLLKRVILSADQVIINGDFWEGYQISFSDFIKSPWKKLFPLLKKKKAIYVYGNHDKKEYLDKRVKLFSYLLTKQYQKKINGQLFFFEHGNSRFPLWDDIFKIKTPSFLIKIYNQLISFLLKIFGKKILYFLYQHVNKKIKNNFKKEKNFKKSFLICGHSHWAEIDKNSHFANCGVFNYGLGQYLLIEDGKINLHESWYNR
ncbi:MAG: metallophosphoesterase family protein [Microgenomates group bacterium]|nr:metallophosphoesterase family protein [Microgenomates group bacterium]